LTAAPDSSARAERETKRRERSSLAGSYLNRAIDDLRASGSSDRLYYVIPAPGGEGRVPRAALGKRLARGRQRDFTRSSVLFAILAAEAYANQYLQAHLSGKEFEAADKLPTFDKYLLGPRLVSGQDLLDRQEEPAGTLRELLSERSKLVHPKLDKGSGAPRYTPADAARYIVAVADSAGWLLANSEPVQFDLTVATVDSERQLFLAYGRKATDSLAKPSDAPAPDLVSEAWRRGGWLDKPEPKANA